MPARPRASGSVAPAMPEHTLGGKLRDGLLSDLLQLISSNVMSGCFTVDDGNGEIDLYFDEGEVCHAAGCGMVGEDAVFALIAREEGAYWFRETTDLPEERTVQSKTQFLILEGLRRADESLANG